jgi:alcohol dehydrogenase (cytochrome c)
MTAYRIVLIVAASAAVVAATAAQQPATAPAPVAPPVVVPMPAALRNYRPVTAARLRAPEAGEWLMNRRTYDGWGYSPLTQITPANVARLQPAWIVSTGALNGHESALIVNGDVMFASTPGNQVIALDVRTGTPLWRYNRPLAPTVIARHPTTRGIALYDDKVFLAANDAVLVALDARTGRIRWTTTVAENREGYS